MKFSLRGDFEDRADFGENGEEEVVLLRTATEAIDSAISASLFPLLDFPELDSPQRILRGT